jgi:hypothetical protein
MLNYSPQSKIFVDCPAGSVTGGTELLHQLVDLLNRNGKRVYMVYRGAAPHIIPEAFSQYRITVAEQIEDDGQNILILPEVVPVDMIVGNGRIQILFWWLSVDNFFNKYGSLRDIRRWKPGKVFAIFFKRLKHPKRRAARISIDKHLKSPRITHAWQSEYAHDFLRRVGILDGIPLKDYINTDYLTGRNDTPRENIVLYNPAKGLKITKGLMKAAPHLTFKAIKGMTREEVREAMLKAKVYIDFGNFPGKDRLPRECAMSGCCIITGKQGAAGFQEDVPIESRYKFARPRRAYREISALIDDIFANFDTHASRFDSYRHQIAGEKEEFENQVAQAIR